tara:strand:- start:78 stop:1814 length:1737 start_codon:yes stop_codon:yes gene_type:complete
MNISSNGVNIQGTLTATGGLNMTANASVENLTLTNNGTIIFDNSQGSSGVNKIDLYNNDFGFGVDTNTLKYISNQYHTFYYGADSNSNGTEAMIINNKNVEIKGTLTTGDSVTIGGELTVNSNLTVNDLSISNSNGGKLTFDDVISGNGPNKVVLGARVYGLGVNTQGLNTYFSGIGGGHIFYYDTFVETDSNTINNGKLGVSINENRMGINTVPSESYNLDVNGNEHISGYSIIDNGLTVNNSILSYNIDINNNNTGNNTQGGKISFDNTWGFSGPNKISLREGNGYGIGVSTNTVKYLTDDYHKFYYNSTATTDGNVGMTIYDTNVGIGTENPSTYLNIYSNSANSQNESLLIQSDNSDGYASIVLSNTSSNNGRFYIVPTGSGWAAGQDKLLFGNGSTSSNNAKMTLDSNGNLNVVNSIETVNATMNTIQTTNLNSTNITTSDINVEDISVSGNIAVGVANPSEKIEVDGNVKATQFYSNSDIRLKYDIKSIDNGLDKVCKLSGKKYKMKMNDNEEIGFIAQEIEQIVPELVKEDNSDEKYKSISYGNVTALLVEAIKELRQEVKDLKNEIQKLK